MRIIAFVEMCRAPTNPMFEGVSRSNDLTKPYNRALSRSKTRAGKGLQDGHRRRSHLLLTPWK